MKKFLVAILAIVYLASSAGATVHTHYCMGEMYSVDFTKAKDDCSKCGMKSAKHCCNDELKTLKLRESYNAVSNNINLSIPVVAIIDKTQNYIHSGIIITAPSFTTNNNSPPAVTATSLCILNCVFRI